MKNEQIHSLRNKALKQLKQGKSLFGKDGAFAPLLKQFIEQALDAEMEAHLTQPARKNGNKRNGKGRKTIKSAAGSFQIQTPQDRQSTFQPEIIHKRETILADSLQDKIIGLYGLGMSYRDIASHIQEIYDTQLSHTLLSQITDRIIPQVKAWQNRPLDLVYPIVWLDAMYCKVKEQDSVKTKALYNVLAVNTSGRKEVIGVYLAESEGAKFWLQVLTDLQNRGLKDILIACTDNLKGFSEAIEATYPQVAIQSCIVHQVRNSLRYIASKDQKEFAKDLKSVYQATTKTQAEQNLVMLAKKWENKYPIVIKSWQSNWEKLSTYFAYTAPIRKLIYTTNAIEGYHRQIRKVTKNKSTFPNDMALLKLTYLATQNIIRKWTMPLPNWSLTIQQLAIKFGDRLPLHLNMKDTA